MQVIQKTAFRVSFFETHMGRLVLKFYIAENDLDFLTFLAHLLSVEIMGMSHYAQFKDLKMKSYHSFGTRF